MEIRYRDFVKLFEWKQQIASLEEMWLVFISCILVDRALFRK